MAQPSTHVLQPVPSRSGSQADVVSGPLANSKTQVGCIGAATSVMLVCIFLQRVYPFPHPIYMFIRVGTEPQFFDSLDTNLVTCKYLNVHVK